MDEKTKSIHEVEERVAELLDELSALCEENHIGAFSLCVRGLPVHEAFKMGMMQGARMLADLEESAEFSNDTRAYVNLENMRSSAAFALGLIKAFMGTRIRMADDLEEMYAEECMGNA